MKRLAYKALGGMFFFPDRSSLVRDLPRICSRFADTDLPKDALEVLGSDFTYEGKMEVAQLTANGSLLTALQLPGSKIKTWAQAMPARQFFDCDRYAQDWIAWIGVNPSDFNQSLNDGTDLAARFDERLFNAFDASTATEMIGPHITRVPLLQYANNTVRICDYLWPLHASTSFELAETTSTSRITRGKRGSLICTWQLGSYYAGSPDAELDFISQQVGRRCLSKIWPKLRRAGE